MLQNVVYPLLFVLVVVGFFVWRYSVRDQWNAERLADDSHFRHILALLASTRLVIAIRRAPRT